MLKISLNSTGNSIVLENLIIPHPSSNPVKIIGDVGSVSKNYGVFKMSLLMINR